MQAILFDFNGTMFFDSDKHDKAWQIFLPKYGRGDVSLETLSRERWLLREEGSSSRAFFENQLALNFDHPLQTLSLNASDTILSCVYHNLGITFISSRILGQPLYAGHFVRLHTGKRFLRRFVLCYHPDKYMSPTLEKWIRFCRAWNKDITS